MQYRITECNWESKRCKRSMNWWAMCIVQFVHISCLVNVYVFWCQAFDGTTGGKVNLVQKSKYKRKLFKFTVAQPSRFITIFFFSLQNINGLTANLIDMYTIPKPMRDQHFSLIYRSLHRACDASLTEQYLLTNYIVVVIIIVAHSSIHRSSNILSDWTLFVLFLCVFFSVRNTTSSICFTTVMPSVLCFYWLNFENRFTQT